MKGTITTLRRDKGFAFITGEDQQEYFGHHSAFRNVRFAEVREGDEVRFEGMEGPKGLRAESIYV